MWQMIALVLASAPADEGRSLTVKGTVFGPRQRLVCEWFTNFENSRFEQCRVAAGGPLSFKGGASIECLGQTCERLDAQARKLASWKKPESVWGTFQVEFYGRLSAVPRAKRYLGDGTSTVLIEQLVSVRKR